MCTKDTVICPHLGMLLTPKARGLEQGRYMGKISDADWESWFQYHESKVIMDRIMAGIDQRYPPHNPQNSAA